MDYGYDADIEISNDNFEKDNTNGKELWNQKFSDRNALLLKYSCEPFVDGDSDPDIINDYDDDKMIISDDDTLSQIMSILKIN